VLRSCSLNAQTVDFRATGAPIASAPVDKDIAAAIASASPERIHKNIETPVNFKNRMTTGSAETDLPAGTGVLAAAAWIEEQFESAKPHGVALEGFAPGYLL
jgi:hypothetical protein